jgi:hypothetical protein
METEAKAEAALPPSGDETRVEAREVVREQNADRIVTVTASTDPYRALANIAQQRAESTRRSGWKRASQALLVLGVLAAALMIPRFREHGMAAAPVSGTTAAAARTHSSVPAAASAAAVAPADAEQLVLPAVATPEDPSARCDSHFKARTWRAAIEHCSAAFDATPSATLAMRLAHAHWAHGDAAGAGTWARNALELESKDPDAYVLIGNAEHAAGKRKKAVAAYRHYLELAPHGWHAARLRAFIRPTGAGSAPQ